VFESIAADKRSSATELVKRAAGELAEAIERIDARDPGSFWNELLDLSSELVWAQRDMAPFLNLASAVLAAAERGVLSGGPVDAVAGAAISAAAEVWEFTDRNTELVATEAERALPPCSTAATLSSSAAVEATLARMASRNVGVLVAESLPALEGAELARRLQETGLEATIVPDAEFPDHVGSSDVVLLGADAVTEQSFINKVGSLAAATAAQKAGVSLYVLAQKSKIIPSALVRTTRSADVPDGPAVSETDGGVISPLLEAVPINLVRAVITQDGPVRPDALEALLRSRPVSPAMLDILFRRAPR